MKPRAFRAEREFGLIVGAAFSLLGAWWLFRGKFFEVARILVPFGIGLFVLGAVFPRILFYPNKAWMKLAEGMSFVSTRIILAFVFFLVLTPIGMIKRAMGWDPLRRRSQSLDSYWQPYSRRQLDPRHYEKMF